MEPMPAAETSEDARRFAGAQKAAAILLAMGKPPATRLLKHLEPQELREVTRAAAQLGAVPSAALESLVEEFTARVLGRRRACSATSDRRGKC